MDRISTVMCLGTVPSKSGTVVQVAFIFYITFMAMANYQAVQTITEFSNYCFLHTVYHK